jgi:hypothetical protein
MGLKKMRKMTGKKPSFNCSNCRCKRYTVCGCKSKGAERKESANG